MPKLKLPEISIGPFAIDGIKIDVETDPGKLYPMITDDKMVRIRVTLATRYLDTGEPGAMTVFDERIARRALEQMRDDRAYGHLQRNLYFARVVRDLLIKAVAHEIDEWLLIDGQRVVEPHPPPDKPSPMPNHAVKPRGPLSDD